MSDDSGLPSSPDPWAFFLDVDGTLIDIAPTPEAVVIPPDLPDMLARLAHRAHGALAIVSGRPLDSLDRFFAPAHLPAAGIHGAEMRFPDGSIEAQAAPELESVRGALRAIGGRHPELLVEEKSVSVTIHYRLRPELEPVVRAEIERIIAGVPGLALQPGKMMLEVRPASADKGRALARFMQARPFVGRRPLAVGDDLTDEHMFRIAVELGGLAVRVGREPRDTAATAHVADTESVRRWLSNLTRGPK
jgi:trehalose 6-phosphate phosphatase